VRIIERRREDDSDEMASAPFVIGVGKGVNPAYYHELEAIKDRLGAALCATRKVTDKGWMPRARQVGITGHSIAPRLYIAIGLSGNFNHTAGVRSAGTIIAINRDPDAEIFEWADVGFVGDWRTVLDALAPALARALSV
jgi:electron transfer flavoprotein alpha subunit